MHLGLRRILISAAALALLSGAGAAATATAASAQPAVALRPPVAAFDINGRWVAGGVAGPVIANSFNAMTIDMSYAHRPPATGRLLTRTTISVTFPDAGTFIGTLQAPDLIVWSNGTIWEKTFTGVTEFDLNGDTWTPGLAVTYLTDGLLTVDMSAMQRPTASGYIVNGTTITVTFPDAGTFIGTLQPPDVIRWSNGTTWTMVPLR